MSHLGSTASTGPANPRVVGRSSSDRGRIALVDGQHHDAVGLIGGPNRAPRDHRRPAHGVEQGDQAGIADRRFRQGMGAAIVAISKVEALERAPSTA